MSESFPTPEKPSPSPSRDPGNLWTPALVGLILVLVGGYLLLSNLGLVPGGFILHNWWALFILIPALGSLGRAWQDYRENGTFTRAGQGQLVGGVVLLAITGIFLFDLDWSFVWPVLLILIGLALLTGRIGRG